MKRVLLLTLLFAAPVLAQGLYPRDASKQKGAPSWLDLQGMWTGPNGGDDIEEHDYVDVSTSRRASSSGWAIDDADGRGTPSWWM